MVSSTGDQFSFQVGEWIFGYCRVEERRSIEPGTDLRLWLGKASFLAKGLMQLR